MIGIDIVDIGRVKKIYDRHGLFFVSKILNEEEIAELLPQQHPNFYQSLGSFIAAKEAVFKACSQEELDWKEIRIYNIMLNPGVSVTRAGFNSNISLTVGADGEVVLAQAVKRG